MNPLVKLIIPIGLGIAAAAINWQVMSSAPPPRTYAIASAEVKTGQTFKENSIGQLVINGESAAALARTAVPYDHREAIIGRVVTAK